MAPFGPVLLAAGIMVLVWLCDIAASAARASARSRGAAAWRQAGVVALLLLAAWRVQGPAPQPRLVFMLQLLSVIACALGLAQWRLRLAQARGRGRAPDG